MLTADNFAHWPRSARRIAEALGIAATVKLHGALGGTRHYIPRTGPLPPAIVGVLGEADAERLRAALGSAHHDFVRGARCGIPARNASLKAERAAGIPVVELARRHGLTSRRVRALIAASKR